MTAREISVLMHACISALPVSVLVWKGNADVTSELNNDDVSSTTNLVHLMQNVCRYISVIKSYLAKIKLASRCERSYIAHNGPALYSVRNGSGNRKARLLLSSSVFFFILNWPSFHLLAYSVRFITRGESV